MNDMSLFYISHRWQLLPCGWLQVAGSGSHTQAGGVGDFPEREQGATRFQGRGAVSYPKKVFLLRCLLGGYRPLRGSFNYRAREPDVPGLRACGLDIDP